MSYGALFAGASALRGNSAALGAVSENIANTGTTAARRKVAQFTNQVTSQLGASDYSPGGVKAIVSEAVSAQGLIQQTSEATDLAISGKGFFVVNRVSGNGGSHYTRAGSFTTDKNGFLKNTAGFYLQGWSVDSSGVPTSGNTSILDNLTTINVNGITNNTRDTKNIKISATLPANAKAGAKHKTVVTIYDSLGVSHELQADWEKAPAKNKDIAAISASAIAAAPVGGLAGVANGFANALHANTRGFIDGSFNPLTGIEVTGTDADATISLTVGGVKFRASDLDLTAPLAAGPLDLVSTTNPYNKISLTLTGDCSAVNSVANMRAALATHLAGVTEFKSVSAANIVGVNGVTAVTAGPDTSIGDYVISFDETTDTWHCSNGSTDKTVVDTANNGIAHTVDFGNGITLTLDNSFSTATAVPQTHLSFSHPTPDPAVWLLTVTTDGTVTQGGGVNNGVDYTKVPITFDGKGNPAALTGFNGADAMPNINIAWNFPNTSDASSIKLNLGTAGESNGLRSLSDTFTNNVIEQDGVRFGTFNGIKINDEGIVYALFDNGETLSIFKIPLANFANVNELAAESGNVYTQTDASGEVLLGAAKTGGLGKIASSALEASTIDLAIEFSNMILYQSVYSANAKVMTTAQEMLQIVSDIKR